MHLYKPVVKDTPHFASRDIASAAQYSLCSCLVLNRSSLTKACAFFFAFFIGTYYCRNLKFLPWFSSCWLV